MRISFISMLGAAAWGGSEELWGRTAEALANRGHAVGVSVRSGPDLAKQLKKLAGLGVQFHFQKSHFGLLERLKNRFSNHNGGSLGEIEVQRWLESFKPDLVCINNGGCVDGLMWMKLCAKAGWPFVTIGQANAEWGWPTDSEAEQITKALNAARACYFVSQANLNLLQDQIAADLPNASVVRNPFNVSYEVSLPWPDETGGLRLACVGRLDPGGKGQDLLLHVLARPEWRARNLKVTFYGGGNCAGGVQRLARRFGLTSVDFRGHVANVEDIWRENHALILPSRCEGLPLAAVEAMLCSRLAIVTDVAGNTELVEDGVSGFVAVAPKKELLAVAMECAWERRENWQAMGRAARQRAVQLIPKDPIALFSEQLLAQATGTE